MQAFPKSLAPPRPARFQYKLNWGKAFQLITLSFPCKYGNDRASKGTIQPLQKAELFQALEFSYIVNTKSEFAYWRFLCQGCYFCLGRYLHCYSDDYGDSELDGSRKNSDLEIFWLYQNCMLECQLVSMITCSICNTTKMQQTKTLLWDFLLAARASVAETSDPRPNAVVS